MSDQIIQFKNVTFTYNEAKRPAVSDLTFSVQRGDWFTILGKNGGGKSTITRLINGLLVPDEDSKSEIYIDDQKLNMQNLWDIRDKVGIVFQNPENQFVGATVGDDVAFGLENRGVPREKMIPIVKNMLEKVGMLDYLETEPSNLSGGQKQRVAIAGILAVKPKILVLDESTSMLDPQGRYEIINLVKKIKDENNLTVIFITHNVEEIKHSDQVMVLDHGKKITLATSNEIFRNKDLIKKYDLELPLFYKVISELEKNNLEVPVSIDSEEKLINYLCQLNSKM